MTPDRDKLWKAAQEGDRDAAIALWWQIENMMELALEDIEVGLQAAALLRYKWQVEHWLGELAHASYWDALEVASRVLGVVLEREKVDEVEALFQSFEGLCTFERTLGLWHIADGICGFAFNEMRWNVLRLNERPVLRNYRFVFTFSVYTSGVLCFYCGVHSSSKPTGHSPLGDIFPEAFGGWESWDHEQKRQAMSRWIQAHPEGVVRFSMCEPSASFSGPLLSPGDGLLSDAENEILATSLGILDMVPGADFDPMYEEEDWNYYENWQKILKPLTEAKEPLSELFLALLNRAFEGWPDERRHNLLFHVISPLGECPALVFPNPEEVWGTLARTVEVHSFPDPEQRAAICRDALHRTRVLHVWCEDAETLPWLLDHSPCLTYVNELHFRFGKGQNPEGLLTKGIEEHGIWEQLMSLQVYYGYPTNSHYHWDASVEVQDPPETETPFSRALSRASSLRALLCKDFVLSGPITEQILALEQLDELNLYRCSFSTAGQDILRKGAGALAKLSTLVFIRMKIDKTIADFLLSLEGLVSLSLIACEVEADASECLEHGLFPRLEQLRIGERREYH